jgi:hypothetical protein
MSLPLEVKIWGKRRPMHNLHLAPSIVNPEAADMGSCDHSERYRCNPSFGPLGEGGNTIHNLSLVLSARPPIAQPCKPRRYALF